MINTFTALLEAWDTALGRFRCYRLQASQDLFGFWVMEVTFGRIGAAGRVLRYTARDEAEARTFVDHRLRCRATAPETDRRWLRPFRVVLISLDSMPIRSNSDLFADPLPVYNKSYRQSQCCPRLRNAQPNHYEFALDSAINVTRLSVFAKSDEKALTFGPMPLRS